MPSQCPLRIFGKLFKNLWLFTKDDFFTFMFPNTIFGVCIALAGPPFVDGLENAALPLKRIPLVLLFNFTNLLVFDLSNQRLWESIKEDRLNKSWRPIPSGQMTRSETRRALQVLIPFVLAINHYGLNVGAETACIMVGCWSYNDLKAGDDNWIIRNAVIALGFGVFNWASLKVGVDGGGISGSTGITAMGYTWICMYSLVVVTTMHVQDMKDQAGDKARGRRTAPLVLGDRVARWSLAIPIIIWAPACAFYCRANIGLGVTASVFGVYLSWRCLILRQSTEDRRTWHLWCVWTAILSLMPMH
ncbi:hypothetical protein EJ04DRAFT_452955 [Polyplosphaeria fusca]|uniref:UbiA prenyltransferase n=1 Tax=Polyplosphaeria fusca TaxID=682080 RepID=A0A9P4UV98_9PLEO|nr:hypothetical protein EJ04DRAFT_452955 [Polyplosphaeria fusca]